MSGHVKIAILVPALALMCLPLAAQEPDDSPLRVYLSFEEGEITRVTLGLDEFSHGELVDRIDTACGPVGVQGRNGRFLPEKPNTALIFDSSCRQGDPAGPPADPEDCPEINWDLGTPNEAFEGPGRSEDGSGDTNDTALGNLLIVAKQFGDRNGNGLVDEPTDEDDPLNNPSLYFDFSTVQDGKVSVESIDLIDIEEDQITNGAGIQFFDLWNALIASGLFPLTGDNGVAKGWDGWTSGTTVEDVVRMTVAMQGSGAIDNLTFTCGRERPQPPPGDKGCSQGYWKEHRDSWPPTWYSPEQPLHSVFVEVSHYPSLVHSSLIEALNFDGGEDAEGAARNLFRQAVAALLNAAHPYVYYPLTEQQVIDKVNEALASRHRDFMLDLKDDLDRKNNLGCTLN